MTAQAGAILNTSSAWDAVDWRTIEDNVRRLHARIVKAVQQKKWNKVKALQHLLTHSASGKLLAVRRVTVNDGRKTPGVDGKLWDTPHKKLHGVISLTARGYRPMPLRRIYIPKANGKLRPLGIPTMRDRAMQALYLLALDPVAETTADQNSYGFRQGRSCADAMEQCFTSLCHKNPSWVLEGDIKGCFDNISHQWLLANIPMNKAILHKWLSQATWKSKCSTTRSLAHRRGESYRLRCQTSRSTASNAGSGKFSRYTEKAPTVVGQRKCI